MRAMQMKWLGAVLTILVGGGLLFVGCQKATAPASSVKPASSNVSVENRADGLHIKSSQAEFVLTAKGQLLASKEENGKTVSIDEAGSGDGITVNGAAGKAVGDFTRDLAHAEIGEANGKLGALGKKIVVK